MAAVLEYGIWPGECRPGARVRHRARQRSARRAFGSKWLLLLPLWTNLSPIGEVGIIDWYTLLVGAASLLALAVHGSLWVVLKTEGSLQERTRSFGAKCWLGSIAITMLMSG